MPIRTAVPAVALAAALLVPAGFASAQAIAITGGTVHPVSGPPIENATVVIENGRIIAIGTGIAVPAGARRIDARGKWVTPGFINAATSLGLSEGGGPSFSGGYNDASARGADGIAASFAAWRGVNPVNTLIIPARREGVTSVVGAPRGGMTGGTAGLSDLVDATSASAMLRRAPTAMVGNFASPGSGQTGARAELWARWQALFADVRDYAARRAAYEAGATRDLGARRADLEALVPVVRGELPLLLTVNRASDILAALAFAREEGIRLWIEGGAEAWQVATAIAEAGVPVFTGAMSNIPGGFDALGQRQENAAGLRAAGVTEVLGGNGPGAPESFDVRTLRQEAGNAVAYGMAWGDALRAITLAPAEVLGVADRVGSLQVGRDANLVIWSGDPFEFASVAEQVFVEGRTFDTPSRQELLTERYRTLPPDYRGP